MLRYSCTKCADYLTFSSLEKKITIDNTQINYHHRPNTVLVFIHV